MCNIVYIDMIYKGSVVGFVLRVVVQNWFCILSLELEEYTTKDGIAERKYEKISFSNCRTWQNGVYN